MLVAIDESTFRENRDEMYQLALDKRVSSYPTFADTIKTKDDFIGMSEKAFTHPGDGMLGYYQEDSLMGWIHYYAIEDEKYFSTVTMLAKEGYQFMLDEFCAWIDQHYPDYDVYLNFPEENQSAITWLNNSVYTCIEKSHNLVLHFKDYDLRDEAQWTHLMTEENHPSFRLLHQLYEENMYWNSERLLAHLKRWDIIVYEENGQLSGALYAMKGSQLVEIFGIDFKDKQVDPMVLQALLVSYLNLKKNDGVKALNYFVEDEALYQALDSFSFLDVGCCCTYLRKRMF